jgi:hypothetical protein
VIKKKYSKEKHKAVNKEDFGGNYVDNKERDYPQDYSVDAEDIAGGITLPRR